MAVEMKNASKRRRAAYRRGWEDHAKGVSHYQCPYPMAAGHRHYGAGAEPESVLRGSAKSRTLWFDGWYDAYIDSRLGTIFKRWENNEDD